ncbi:extracellular solute-binding protein [Rhabdothermincola sediminis]|uniref:extracellular solute-binding protein n=1 Tax=Rhabdothermincola sediminis TaxID=2751370 RepID=UPI001AA0773A|nr:extracellular solute-binding protein [Rhabdothermincola sediminis]
MRTRPPRRITALASLAATMLVLGACSSNGGSGGSPASPGAQARGELPDCPVGALDGATQPVEVVLWYALSAKTEATLQAQVQAYNGSQSRVRVRAENQGPSYEELLRKFEATLPTPRDLPDIIVSEETTTRFMIDSGTVLPAQSCLDAEGLSTDPFVKPAVDYFSVDGILYPASASLSDILTYYNKNHFRRAGLDPDKPPATLAEVREYAEKIKAAGVVDRPVVLKLDSWFLETQLTGSGVPLVNNDNGRGGGETTEAAFAGPEALAVLQWVKDLNDAGLLQGVTATPGQVNHYLAMAQQNGSILVETSTAATSVKAFLGGDTSVAAGVDAGNVDLAALDIGAGPVYGVDEAGKAQVGGNAFFMLKTSSPAEQAGAWDFMKWWNQLDQQVIWHLEGSYLPWLRAAADDPRIRAFWRDDLAGRWLAIAYDEMVTGIDPDFPGPLIGPYDRFRAAIRKAFDSVVLSRTEPQTAMDTAVSEINAALAQYNDTDF